MSAKQDESGCVKVWIDLPNHWATGGESMWARPVGPDLYELRNVPFHAYGLNFLDVVRAVPRQSDQKPEVLTVVRPSGHRTLRVIFNECVAIPDRGPLLAQLNPLGTTYENADAVQFSIDIEPDGYYERVCQQLDEWEQTGLLSYETCEPRVAGTFDDAPPEEDG